MEKYSGYENGYNLELRFSLWMENCQGFPSPPELKNYQEERSAFLVVSGISVPGYLGHCLWAFGKSLWQEEVCGRIAVHFMENRKWKEGDRKYPAIPMSSLWVPPNAFSCFYLLPIEGLGLQQVDLRDTADPKHMSRFTVSSGSVLNLVIISGS